MEILMPLEDYYQGDEPFEKYSKVFSGYWDTFKYKDELLRLVDGDLVLARPIAYHLQDDFENWFQSKIPALDNLTPAECMQTDWGKRRLKCCLHRFP